MMLAPMVGSLTPGRTPRPTSLAPPWCGDRTSGRTRKGPRKVTGWRAAAGPPGRRTGCGHIPMRRILFPANTIDFPQPGPRGDRMTMADPRQAEVIALRPGDLDRAGHQAGTG